MHHARDCKFSLVRAQPAGYSKTPPTYETFWVGPGHRARDEVEARLGRPWRPAQNARRNLPALQKFSQSFSKFRLHLKESVWLAGSLKFTVLSSVCSQHISDDRVLLQGKLCLFCSV